MKHVKPINQKDFRTHSVNEIYYGDKQSDIDTIKTHLKRIHDYNIDVQFEIIGNDLKLSFRGTNLLTATNNNLGVTTMSVFISGLASGIIMGKES